ncbi:4Fe-4S binding protein [Bacillus sp. B15-48]|uniref:4Fe-4S binding protein n=1 Tax=Bacillus sp. B15-48 TaxID=1548601 RepID=UPI00193FA0C7|nr:4Fe-4S binding protein [Bacillus sp. B15-48]MBM4765252.1 hypothetical protein [Bacillus sp. B15-48]
MIFDQISKLSNVFLKKIDKIEVDANKCLKVRAVTSSCTACVDICPASSIDIMQDSIEIEASCFECGLCTSVCLTNALKWNHPPLMQILDRLKRLSNREAEVYLTCEPSAKGNEKSNGVQVSCLGVLPTEFWISAGQQIPNLKIIYQSTLCDTCKLCDGEKLFLRYKEEAEKTLQHTFPICFSINEVKDEGLIDHHRRKFLSSIFEEAKATNTIAVKEVLEVDQTLSPFEKFNRYYRKQTELEEMAEVATEMKNNFVDKLVNDTVFHTDKRALLFEAFEVDPQLSKEMTFSMPEVKESCTRCGACAFLCPTDALIMDAQSLILSTNKCVSCGLCEEICYENHIHMSKKRGTVFNEKFIYLTK